MPKNLMPLGSSAATRRSVSVKSELPPSMRMSPASRSGFSSSITASTGPPAFTIVMMRRGRSSAATNSAGRLRADEVLALGVTGEQRLGLLPAAVVDGDGEAVALDVAGEVLAHDGEPDESDLLHAPAFLGRQAVGLTAASW